MAKAKLLSQKLTTRSFTLLKVTTCLYLKFNNSTRSLSTLIAVSVNKDTPQEIAAIVLLRTAT